MKTTVVDDDQTPLWLQRLEQKHQDVSPNQLSMIDLLPVTAAETVIGGEEATTAHRYRLWRILHPRMTRRVLWIMHNPSTANASKNDPTMRKVLHFSMRLHASRVDVVNLFALRSSKPSDVIESIKINGGAFPIGWKNDEITLNMVKAMLPGDAIVLAWGSLPKPELRRRADDVESVVMANAGPDVKLLCLGYTKVTSDPFHPLWRPNETELVRYTSREKRL